MREWTGSAAFQIRAWFHIFRPFHFLTLSTLMFAFRYSASVWDWCNMMQNTQSQLCWLASHWVSRTQMESITVHHHDLNEDTTSFVVPYRKYVYVCVYVCVFLWTGTSMFYKCTDMLNTNAKCMHTCRLGYYTRFRIDGCTSIRLTRSTNIYI